MILFVFLSGLLIAFGCYCKALPNGGYASAACYITLLLLERGISGPVRYSYLSFISNDNAGIFAASLLISYFCFFVFNHMINWHD